MKVNKMLALKVVVLPILLVTLSACGSSRGESEQDTNPQTEQSDNQLVEDTNEEESSQNSETNETVEETNPQSFEDNTTAEEQDTPQDQNVVEQEEDNKTVVSDCIEVTPLYSFTLVDTNQQDCYGSMRGATVECSGTGQDGEFSINPHSYTFCEEDTVVVDNHTGLMWSASTDTDGVSGINDDDKMTYDQGVEYCADLSLGNYTDWRLPSMKELYSIYLMSGQDLSGLSGATTPGTSVDYSAYPPFIDTNYFDVGYGDTSKGERIIDGQYLTSTKNMSRVMRNQAEAFFGVNFVDGHVKAYEIYEQAYSDARYYVRCVRGDESYGQNSFKIVDSDTVIDEATNIMWERSDHSSSDYADALDICNDSEVGGYTDWRLPNVKELQSIVDYTRSPDKTNSPAIDTDYFNSTEFVNEAGERDWGYYWSSTALLGTSAKGDKGAYITFGRGLGYDNGVVDAHGAGAQRSDYKNTTLRDTDNVTEFSVDPSATFGTTAYRKGPQGDIIRVEHNFVRCMRNN